MSADKPVLYCNFYQVYWMALSNNQIQGTSGFFFFLQYLKIFRSCIDISADAKLEKVWNLRMINNMVH